MALVVNSEYPLLDVEGRTWEGHTFDIARFMYLPDTPSPITIGVDSLGTPEAWLAITFELDTLRRFMRYGTRTGARARGRALPPSDEYIARAENMGDKMSHATFCKHDKTTGRVTIRVKDICNPQFYCCVSFTADELTAWLAAQ